jgi:hypothetical protein
VPAGLGYGLGVVPAGPLGVRDARARTFATAFVLALVIHLPCTPLPFMFSWVRAYLDRDTKFWDYEDDKTLIPISLLDDEPADPSRAAPGRAEPASGSAQPGRSRALETFSDAGIRDAPEEPQEDAAPADARPRVRAAARTSEEEAGAAEATPSDAHAVARAVVLDAGGGGPSVQDPLSLVGGLRRAVEGKPNVSIVLWFSTIREHPLGPLVGGLLGCIPQWRDFVGDLVNPLTDLDGVMLVGPQMRDTSKVTILAQSRMEDDRVQSVFAALAHKPGGNPVPAPPGTRAVKFRADRADRIAFTHPRSMIIVTPPEGFEQLRDLKGPLSLPAGKGRALSVGLVNPWRPARAIGLRLPETLREVRINVAAAPDGGIDIAIEFDDASPEAAEAHAPDISAQVRAIGGLLFSDLEFVAESNHLSAETHVSRLFSAVLLGYLRPMLCPFGPDGGRAGR